MIIFNYLENILDLNSHYSYNTKQKIKNSNMEETLNTVVNIDPQSTELARQQLQDAEAENLELVDENRELIGENHDLYEKNYKWQVENSNLAREVRKLFKENREWKDENRELAHENRILLYENLQFIHKNHYLHRENTEVILENHYLLAESAEVILENRRLIKINGIMYENKPVVKIDPQATELASLRQQLQNVKAVNHKLAVKNRKLAGELPKLVRENYKVVIFNNKLADEIQRLIQINRIMYENKHVFNIDLEADEWASLRQQLQNVKLN